MYGKFFEARAVNVPESIPPDKYEPSSTSVTNCRLTAFSIKLGLILHDIPLDLHLSLVHQNGSPNMC